MTLRLGFIGFGEAASAMARGLRGEGVEVSAYDANWNVPPWAARIQERAAQTGAQLVPTPEALSRCSEVIISSVVSSAAVPAATAIAPYLTPSHWYADMNSASPATKRAVAEVLAGSGCRFVDFAVMAAVPPHQHRVPILAAGEHAAQLAEILGRVGMRIRVVGTRPGQASAIKMFRSIVVKGLEALAVEAVAASYPFQAHEMVLQSLDESFADMTLGELCRYLLVRHGMHGERRAKEMQEVTDALRELGVEPVMAEAAFRRLTGSARRVAGRFAGREPSWQEVAQAVAGGPGQGEEPVQP